MKYKRHITLVTAFFLAIAVDISFGQDVSEEAKRHFDRGLAAVEMAKSQSDYAAAINEFEQAARLAPDWPDVYYNLGKVQETAEIYGDAIRSFREYLRLAPDADDAEEIKSLINKLEYKTEQVLSIPDIINVLVEFHDWKYSATLRTADRECNRSSHGEYFWREGSDSLRTFKTVREGRVEYQILKVTGPVLKYVTTINNCDKSGNQEYGNCDSVIEHEVEVVSRRLVKVNQRVLRGGAFAGVADGDEFSCTFQKEESGSLGDKGINAKTQPSSTPQDINAKDPFGTTMLHDAAYKGQKDKVESLIAKGADINVKNNFGVTPLHFAAQEGQKEVADLLINKGADINAKDQSGRTSLYQAASWNRLALVELLIAKGADINARTENGLTSLHIAAFYGNKEVAELLIAKGADINAKDKDGNTPLQIAESNSHKDVADLLRKQGAR